MGVSDRLADDSFRLSILRTDFRDTPAEGELLVGSAPDEGLENNLGVGARRADLSADFTGVLGRGVVGSTGDLKRGVDGSRGVVERD